VVAVAISCVAAEIIIRVVRPQVLPSQEVVRTFVLRGMFLQDNEAGYVPAPNFHGTMDRDGVVTEVSTNSLGLRASELGPKAPRCTRIAVFGDSFTFGWGVPQGQEWVSVIERRINHEIGPGSVEVVNCGVIGYGTESEAILLERLAAQLQPDIVLLGFFANDYMDNFLGARGFYTVREGYLFDQWTHEYFHERFLVRKSHLARLCSTAWGSARERWFKAAPVMRSGQRLSDRDYAEGARRSVELIRRMRDCSAKCSARFGVIWLPPDDYALPSQPPMVPEQDWLHEQIAGSGIPSLDLLPIVRAQQDRTTFYYENDGHFTVRGNRFAGAAVARWTIDTYLREPAAE
jgi:lysophospholipase L1-like esterase